MRQDGANIDANGLKYSTTLQAEHKFLLARSKKTCTFALRFLKLNSVKAFKEYRIPYLGLKLGKHQYQFTLTEEFFDKFEFSEVHKCQLEASVELEKQSTMLVFTIGLAGTVETTCDRCGDDLTLPVSTEHRLIVQFGEETVEVDDEVLVLSAAEHEVDLSQYLYEYAHLALPARHVHANPADCNQESLRALEKYKVDTTANTQWAALKNLNYEDPEDQEEFLDEEE
jgi:uncharacterized protein